MHYITLKTNIVVIKVKTNSSINNGALVRTKKNTIDIRGMRVHEAEAVLEDYLRKNSGPIWVVHGIGTGKLKKGVRSWLKTLSYIDKVIDADSNDGGAGCSIIWLK